MRFVRGWVTAWLLVVPALAWAGDDKKPAPPKPAPTAPAPQAKPADNSPPDKPADKPADKADKPADKPAEKPADKPADRPADKPEKGADKGASAAVAISAANLQLRDVVAKTDELKTRVKDTRAALQAISEEVFRSDTVGARTDVSMTNDMSNAYRLQHIVLLLDSNKITDRTDDNGSIADLKQLPLFSGLLTPGEHTFTLQLTFKGHGYGVFKYLEGYTFNVKSSHAVKATTLPMTLAISAFEKGDQTTALDLRPTVEWKEQVAKK